MNKSKSLLESARGSVAISLTTIWSMGIICLFALFAFSDASRQATNSSQIVRRVLVAENLLRELESSQRGFLYTNRDSYLVDVSKKANLIAENLTEAQNFSDRPEQRSRLAILADLISKKAEELERTVKLQQDGKFDQAKALVLTDTGKQLMDEIGDTADKVIEFEQAYVYESRSKVEKLAVLLQVMVVLGVVILTVFKTLWLRSVRVRLAPLSACVKRANDIAKNRFHETPLPVENNDEIGSLTASINEMTSALSRGASDVDDARRKVAKLAQSLSRRAIEQTAALSQLSAGIQEINTTVQELNLSAAQMSDKVSVSVEAARSREKAGTKGLQAVESTVEASERVRRQVDEVASITVELNQKATRIERIVFFVNELTERSNILSINAALLASSSDGNRDSFSVLADEMQKLTSRSKEATLEIHETLQNIRTEIQRVVLATEETSKQVESGNDAASQASRSISVLKQAVDEGNDTFMQVVAAVRQQNQALAQVEQALTAMRESAELVEEESKRLRTDADLLGELNHKLENTDLLRAVRS